MKVFIKIKYWIIDRWFDMVNKYLVWTYYNRNASFVSYNDCQPLKDELRPIYWNRYWAEKERQLYVSEQITKMNNGKSFLVEAEPKVTRVDKDYVSGCLSSQMLKSFCGKRGEVSLSVQMSRNKGDFPAAWLLAEPGTEEVAEIDIFEWISQKPYHLFFTNHWGEDYAEGHEMSGSKLYFEPLKFDVSLQWDARIVCWYLNGVLIRKIRNYYQHIDFYLLLNLAVGGWSEQPDPEYKSNVIFSNLKGV